MGIFFSFAAYITLASGCIKPVKINAKTFSSMAAKAISGRSPPVITTTLFTECKYFKAAWTFIATIRYVSTIEFNPSIAD